jgi:acetamidase/formamidase
MWFYWQVVGLFRVQPCATRSRINSRTLQINWNRRDQFIDQLGGLRLHGGDQVTIDIQCDGSSGVAQPSRYDVTEIPWFNIKEATLPISIDVTPPTGNLLPPYKAEVNPNNVQKWTPTPITIKGSAGLYQVEVEQPALSTRWDWQVPRNVPFSMWRNCSTIYGITTVRRYT